MNVKTERIPFTADYTADQLAAIADESMETDPSGWMQYDRDGALWERFSGQLFAVFPWIAYELACQRVEDSGEGVVIDYLPAIVDGHAILRTPDEGRPGVLHLMRIVEHRRNPRLVGTWRAIWLHTGSLRPEELMMSAAEINAIIADEVLRGETPITGGRLGWGWR